MRRRLSLGTYCSLVNPQEVELAEKLLSLAPVGRQSSLRPRRRRRDGDERAYRSRCYGTKWRGILRVSRLARLVPGREPRRNRCAERSSAARIGAARRAARTERHVGTVPIQRSRVAGCRASPAGRQPRRCRHGADALSTAAGRFHHARSRPAAGRRAASSSSTKLPAGCGMVSRARWRGSASNRISWSTPKR